MFAMGRDEEYEGLQPPTIILETNPCPLPTGRNIRMLDIVNVVAEENAQAFVGDYGDSSKEDEYRNSVLVRTLISLSLIILITPKFLLSYLHYKK